MSRKPVILFAPEWYWKIPQSEREKGKCGAGNGLGEKLVPETLWFLNVTPACQIHDKMYERGKTLEDKKEADRIFLNNMLRIIEANTNNSILKKLRIRRARIYYSVVDDVGGVAFWKNKNKPDEWGIV